MPDIERVIAAFSERLAPPHNVNAAENPDARRMPVRARHADCPIARSGGRGGNTHSEPAIGDRPTASVVP
jgi:hypothetical protein